MPKIKNTKPKDDHPDDALDLAQEIEDDEEEESYFADDYDGDEKLNNSETKQDEDEEEDELPVDSDFDEEDHDIVEYVEEDDIVPPVPELIRNMTVVKPEDRTTSERLSNFECARILGDRARHIDNGARPYIDTTNFTSSLEIAYAELMQKKIPMAIIRHIGNNSVEIWRLRDMLLPKLPPASHFIH